MKPLTQDQINELDALDFMFGLTGRPSMLHRMYWRGLYQVLVGRGLATWLPMPEGGNPNYRRVRPTPEGRALARRHRKEGKVTDDR